MNTSSLTLAAFLAICVPSVPGDESHFAVTPNRGVFPLPYELPDLKSGSPRDFDWKAYLAAAKSEADRAFRAEVARMGYGQPIAGGGDSNADNMRRGHLAAEEFKAKCDDLVRRYRKKLGKEPEVLKKLNAFVRHREAAIALQVEIIGGSWGGSGKRVAIAEARMNAYIGYYRNLTALGSSLYLQDLPE